MISRKATIPGLILSLGAVVFFLFAAWQWLHLGTKQEAMDIAAIMQNERRTLNTIRLLDAAQEIYKKVDHNDDGRLEYALFPAHLWVTVDEDGNPKPVDLIPREPAFAMGETTAVDGFYFEFLHHRSIAGNPIPLDYGKAWAMTAIPAAQNISGRLHFLRDADGTIYVRQGGEILTAIPTPPEKAGFRPVTSSEDLHLEKSK